MFAKLAQPIPPILVIRLLMVIIIALAFLAGWYHSAWQVELQKNQQLQPQTETSL